MSRFPGLKSSAALVVALGALVVALVGSSPAGGAGKLKPTLHVYKGEFSIGVGDLEYQKIGCGGGERIISGGYRRLDGTVVDVVGAYPTKDNTGYLVAALVPTDFQTPGAERARIQVKAVCADKGKALVP